MQVKVESFKGRLRLRWSHEGQRYSLALGLPNSEVNRTVAVGKATTIHLDLISGNFDQTLAKYRPIKQVASGITALELAKRFTDYKADRLSPTSISKFKALHKPVADFFGAKAAQSVDEDLADRFRMTLAKNLKPSTVKERLVGLNECWDWGVRRGHVIQNPWRQPLKQIKLSPSQKPVPFTQHEMQSILDGFRRHRHYKHYADYVECLMSTGARLGEARGLLWKHLTPDCSAIWIGESVARGGIRKSTKTNRARQFKLPERVQQLLLARRTINYAGDALVFPAPRGGIINDGNFQKRAWRKVLNKEGVDYRYPYTCRHSFISHALEIKKPMDVAEMVGHDPQVLLSRYASAIPGSLEAPDIL